MITQKYNINLIPDTVPVYVRVSQYDVDSRTLEFTLWDGSEEYTIDTSSVVTVRGKKPDETGFEYECTYSGSVVTVPLEAQMTILAGDVPCEIRITLSDAIIGTANFILAVEKTPLDEGTVISETELPLIEEASEAATLAQSYASAAEASATEAASLLSSVVLSVNETYPDSNGNVTIDVGGDVSTVNSQSPDSNGNVVTMTELTQDEYDALSTTEQTNGVAYFITDANVTDSADEVIYDNTSSGLSATNVQDAIDEITVPTDISSQCSWNSTYFDTTESIVAWRCGNVVQVYAWVDCTTAHGVYQWVEAITGLPEVAGTGAVSIVLGTSTTLFVRMQGTSLCINARVSSSSGTYGGYISTVYICK